MLYEVTIFSDRIGLASLDSIVVIIMAISEAPDIFDRSTEACFPNILGYSVLEIFKKSISYYFSSFAVAWNECVHLKYRICVFYPYL